MANIIEVTSLEIPELQMFTHLTDSRLRDRLERSKGIFIAESTKVITYALDAGFVPIALLMERKHIQGQARDIIARCGDIPVYTADREVLASLTGYALTRGVLCAMERKPLPKPEEICREAKRVAILEGVVDATNIGAIFRSAAALGMDGVILSPTCCDPLCRRAIRVGMGTVFQVNWAWAESWPDFLDTLHEMGFATAAMALEEKSLSLEDPRLAEEEKLAILLGTEGTGLAKQTIAKCRYTVMIPMSHGVDSLNVAAAGAVAFWQLKKR